MQDQTSQLRQAYRDSFHQFAAQAAIYTRDGEVPSCAVKELEHARARYAEARDALAAVLLDSDQKCAAVCR